MTPTDAAVLDAVVKAYDVRGLVGSQLEPRLVEALGAAAAEVLVDGEGAMVVGRDMRPSSPMLVDAFVAGVLSRGVDVVDIGLASTDQLTYASGALGLPAAMFTASHNPAAYNGIKLCRSGARPVSIDSGLAQIRDLAAAGLPPTSAASGTRQVRDMLDRFAAHVRSFVDIEAIGSVSVAVDAGNGMAGHVWPAIVAGTGIDTHPLFFELDGTFPNHPANPLDADNLRSLQAAVRAGGHALGLGFDGDADRVFAVDDTGRVLTSSLIGAVIAEHLLRRHPDATILYNVVCSRTVPEAIERAGGRALRTRVGHSFVKEQMAATDAVYAVEHSGHHYFRDNHRADSGVIAALLLLEAVRASGQPLSALIAPHDQYVASGERNVAVDDPGAALDAVRARFAGRATIDELDGLLVDVGEAWFTLRASNTEPYLRLNVEARHHDHLAALVAEVVDACDGGR